MRAGFTLVETVLALALLTVISGAAWLFFGTSSRQTVQLSGYVSTLEACAMLQAALEADLLAITVPPDPAALDAAVEIGEDGRSLAFLRSPRIRDLAGVGAVRRRTPVRWSARPDGARWILVRESPGEATLEFGQAPCQAVRFARVAADHRVFVSVEAVVLEDEGSGGTGRARLPLRLLAPLLPALVAPDYARPAWPTRLLGPPPAEAAPAGRAPDGVFEEEPDESEGEDGDGAP